MRHPNPGKKPLALLTALLMIAQAGMVSALAKPLPRAAAPSGTTAGKVRTLGDSPQAVVVHKDSTTAHYIVNLSLVGEEPSSIDLNQNPGLANIIYFVGDSSLAGKESFSPIEIKNFKANDRVVVASGDTVRAASPADPGWSLLGANLQYTPPGETLLDIAEIGEQLPADFEGPTTLARYVTQAKQPDSSITLTASLLPGQTAGAETYQWYKNNALVSGATNQTLTNAEPGASYYCIISRDGKTYQTNTLQLDAPACNLTLGTASLAVPSSLQIEGDSKPLAATLTIPLTGDCTKDNAHKTNHHGYTVEWTFQKTGTPSKTYTATATNLTVTVTESKKELVANAQVLLPAADFAQDGQVTVTAVVKKDGAPAELKREEKTVAVSTPAEVCNKKINGGTFTSGPAAIDLTTSGTHQYSYTFQPTYDDGACNVTGHQGGDHGQTVNQFALTTDAAGKVPASFFTLGMSNNQVTLTFQEGKTIPKPETKLYLFAMGADNNPLLNTKKEITVKGCDQKYTALSFAAPTLDVKITGENQTIQPPKLSGTLTGVCRVEGHNHEAFQYSHNAPGSLVKSFDAATGKLVLHYGQVAQATAPAGGSSITVTATPKDQPNLKAVMTIRAYRDPVCDKVLTGVTGTASVDMGRANAATQTYTAQFSGTCNIPGHAHTVTWQVKSSTGGSVPGGISIDANGRVTFSRSGLAQQSTKFLVEAASNGVVKQLEVTVTKTVSSSSSGSDDRDRRDREWEDLNYDIEDARSGEWVTQKMGGNTNMPFTVWDTLRGRNVNLELSFTGGYIWTINGSSVKKLPDGYIYIPLEVKEVYDEKIQTLARDNDVVILELQHNGSFYANMRLSYPVGSSYAGKTLYLYKYDPGTNKLSYRTSAKADTDGMVTFPFTSASTYLVSSKALYGETATGSGGGTVGGSSSGTLPPQLPSSSTPPATSSSSSEPESEPPAPPPSSSSQPEASQVTQPEPEEPQKSFPLVPVILVAIAAVVLAIILVARRNNSSYEV